MKSKYFELINDRFLENLFLYLKKNNWKEIHSKNINVKLFECETNKILIPLNCKYDDFKPLIYKAIIDLGQIEKREVDDIIMDVIEIYSDIIDRRLYSIHNETGSIFLDVAIEFYSQIQDAFKAIIHSMSAKPKGYYVNGNINKEGTEFIHNLRLGQTKIGSYSVPIYSKIDADDLIEENLLSDTSNKIPYTRKVFMQFKNSLDNIASILEKGRDVNFEEYVDRGVNGNLCEALSKMAGVKDKHSNLDITVRYSPIITDKNPIQIYKYTYDQLEFLKVGGEKLKNKEILKKSIFIVGKVIGLEREDKHDCGTITIKSKIPDVNGIKKISVVLDSENYNIAITAHKDKQELKIKGDLEIQTRNITMRSISHVSIPEKQNNLFK